jgi:hypothetical protein
MNRFADPRSGYNRLNGKEQTAYKSFVPTPLQDVELNIDDEMKRLADKALAHIKQKDKEEIDVSEEAIKSSVRLAWNVPPLFLMTNDKELEEKSLIDRNNLRNALEYGLEHLETLPLSGRIIKDMHWIAMQGEHNEKNIPASSASLQYGLVMSATTWRQHPSFRLRPTICKKPFTTWRNISTQKTISIHSSRRL